MNTVRQIYTLCAIVLLGHCAALAQELQFTFSGTAVLSDASGKLIAVSVDNARLLHFFAPAMGLGNTDGLELVYHVGGSNLGDTVDVVNASNGAFVFTMFGFYFGEDQTLGRAGLSSGDGTVTRRVEYVYTYQNSHSMGSVMITTHYGLDSSGNTNSILAYGPMQYVFLPAGSVTSVSICNGNFTTGKALTFP